MSEIIDIFIISTLHILLFAVKTDVYFFVVCVKLDHQVESISSQTELDWFTACIECIQIHTKYVSYKFVSNRYY